MACSASLPTKHRVTTSRKAAGAPGEDCRRRGCDQGRWWQYVEVGEKRDRIVDALNATRAAVEQGIVPGGGTALLWASRQLAEVKDSCDNLDQKIGVEIIERACRAPIKAIADNAGEEGSVIVGELLKNSSHEDGYDARKGVYGNMIGAGIMDPTKVVKNALQNAFSVSGLPMTSEACVAGPEAEPECLPCRQAWVVWEAWEAWACNARPYQKQR